MEPPTTDTQTANQNQASRRPRKQQRYPRTDTNPSDIQQTSDRDQTRRQNKPPRTNGSNPISTLGTPESVGAASDGGAKLASRRRPPHPKSSSNPADGTPQTDHSDGPSKPPGESKNRRGARFKGGLTNATLGSQPSSSEPPSSAHHGGKPSNRHRNKPNPNEGLATDLATTLAVALRTPPYPDCPICFSSIHPAQRTWSCSPSIAVIRAPDAAAEEQQYCWTTFHVKCIGEWAAKSVKEVADAWRARGETGRKGDWRCPGCQAKRETLPSGYWCFCGSTPEPKPPRLAIPHSCANPCSRVRESGCGHPCPLACHPGPCPPCQVTTRLECYCPGKKAISFRCGVDQHGKTIGGKGRDLSCGSVCGQKLDCGKHTCERICHEGPCEGCQVQELVPCYCGSTEREVGCGEGEEFKCADNSREWIGRFCCPKQCQMLYDCGIHKCEQPCHPPHQPTVCPLSPSVISHCPCGRYPIPTSSTGAAASSRFRPRENCTSPIPTCDSPCGKAQADCDHPCATTCHTGPCPPCTVALVRPCRCGGTTKRVFCFELRASPETGRNKATDILCDRPCMALRACGRHQCRRICCPLAALSSVKKGKQRRINANSADNGPAVGEEAGGLHECDLICGKTLTCGLHKCEEKDHKGACPRCLRSSFEELFCHCGRTVLEPPIPCGTKIKCNYPCLRPPPPCGHPMTPHSCHEDPDSPCPPCPSLATRECACGKKMMGNIRCSLEKDKVSCGTPCGKLMTCGFHHCERLCHVDECGACTAPCGKLRKHCLPLHHPCPLPCHAPATCSEETPCESLVTLTCPCGRIKQSIQCGRSASNPSGYQSLVLKCNNDCAIAKRNARLAEALGITADSRGKAQGNVTWNEELVSTAKGNAKFLTVVEKAFEEFVNSVKKTQVLPHMPAERRKFVHDIAAVYRMDTQMVDQEPHRSVRLLRRIDTRIPNPLLSSIVISHLNSQPNLGKLADLRSGSSTPASWRSSPPPKPAAPPAPAPPSTQRSPAWVAAAKLPPASTAPASANASPASRLVVLGGSAGPSRTSTPAPPTRAVPEAVSPDAVPDDWEDET